MNAKWSDLQVCLLCWRHSAWHMSAICLAASRIMHPAKLPVYIGAGYLNLKEMFSTGALMAVVNLTIWGSVGAVWWKVIGLY